MSRDRSARGRVKHRAQVGPSLRDVLEHGAIDHPAHDSADEDGEGGGDGEVGSYGEGEGADAEEFDDDDEGYAEEDEGPREFAGEDSVDDGGHEAALRGGGFFAADALDPLDFDLAGGWGCRGTCRRRGWWSRWR